MKSRKVVANTEADDPTGYTVCLGCRGGGRLAIIVVSVVREGRRGEGEMTNVLSTA